MRAILNKYQGYLPGLSNQKLNSYIKEVCQLAGISDPVEINKTVGNERLRKVLEKWDLVTSHTARRSFCTNAYLSGIPTHAIRMITGHKTEKSFLKYIKVTDQENAVIMAENPFFKGFVLKAV